MPTKLGQIENSFIVVHYDFPLTFKGGWKIRREIKRNLGEMLSQSVYYMPFHQAVWEKIEALAGDSAMVGGFIAEMPPEQAKKYLNMYEQAFLAKYNEAEETLKRIQQIMVMNAVPTNKHDRTAAVKAELLHKDKHGHIKPFTNERVSKMLGTVENFIQEIEIQLTRRKELEPKKDFSTLELRIQAMKSLVGDSYRQLPKRKLVKPAGTQEEGASDTAKAASKGKEGQKA